MTSIGPPQLGQSQASLEVAAITSGVACGAAPSNGKQSGRVVARLRLLFAIDLPLPALFQAPSIAALAEVIRGKRAPAPPESEQDLEALLAELEQLSDEEVHARLQQVASAGGER